MDRGCDLWPTTAPVYHRVCVSVCAWFQFAREIAPVRVSPLMHLYSENLTSSLAACNATMAQVYTFLGLPPLRENCNISAVPVEWPCDIQNDPKCSLEKFAGRLSE